MIPGRQERWRRDPRAGVLVIVAGVALAGFVAVAIALLLAPAFVSVDVAVSAAIRSVEVPGLERLAMLATRLGDLWPLTVLTLLTAGVLYARGRKSEAVVVVLTVLGGVLIGAGLKQVFLRVRPALELARIPVPETYSFPSGHALASVLYFGSLGFVALIDDRRLGRAVLVVAGCLFAALSISMSRVYLGVHYLGDVVAAWFLGVAWLAAVVMVSARWAASRPGEDVT
jgi:undecaprenyl-diphosphatase